MLVFYSGIPLLSNTYIMQASLSLTSAIPAFEQLHNRSEIEYEQQICVTCGPTVIVGRLSRSTDRFFFLSLSLSLSLRQSHRWCLPNVTYHFALAKQQQQ